MRKQVARILPLVWQEVGRAVLSTLLPPKCHACGSSTARMTTEKGEGGMPGDCLRPKLETVLNRYLCQACAQTFVAVQPPICKCCGQMFISREGTDHLCGHCISQPWCFGMARSAGVFDRCLATLVHRLKYSGRTGLAKPLGILMLAVLLDNWNLDEIDCVVPVPLHLKRLRERGFNQSFLLSKAWPSMAKAYHTVWPGIPVDPALLNRTRYTASQTGLGKRERVANLKNAFKVRPGKDVANLRLLLVDDVFTTGATVNECSRILLKAGAKCVDVLTLARTR